MDEARKEWYRRRVEAIHARVTAYDVLRKNGVSLGQISDDRPEQISCPFHGKDNKPSARIYPAENDNPSHVWCYVCQEPRWDAIGLWRKFNGDLPYSQNLASIEKAFGLETPEVPSGVSFEENTAQQEEVEAFKAFYMSCESRLSHQRSIYKRMNDMTGYLSAGSILDKVRFRVDQNLWSPAKGTEVLTQLLERIREKARQSPTD